MFRRSLLLGLLASMPLLSPAAAQPASPRSRVVASFSILADFVRAVGGERVAVVSLVGPNGDAHAYQPVPADARRLAEADLIVVNGLGFEGWMDRLVKASGTKAPVIVASAGVEPRAGEGHGHGHRNEADPHAWQTVANAKFYVENIRNGLTRADPVGRDTYAANAGSYLAELEGLDAELRKTLGAIPPERRQLITNHDAFGYFGLAYGIKFAALRGVSSESEPTAKDVARIVRQLKASKSPAVFLESAADGRVMERISRDTGARIGGKLFSDALSEPGGPAGTYLDMMRHNARTLAAALAD